MGFGGAPEIKPAPISIPTIPGKRHRLVVSGIEAPLPVVPRASFLCLPEGFRTHYEGCAVSRASELERVAAATRRLDALARTEPNVRVFHAFDLLCPDAQCRPFRDGKPLVRDSHHLSAWGSGSLAPAFIALLETTRG